MTIWPHRSNMDEHPGNLASHVEGGSAYHDDDGRIGLELRIAVTGHSWIDDDDPAVAMAAQSALAELHRRCSNRPTDSTRVGLTVVTALAEGSDRIVARAGLTLGARLEVILPLPADDYRSDFTTTRSRETFDALLSKADTVVLAGDVAARPAAYATAGRAMLARSDALLALWDGQPSPGEGGTAGIVAQARELDVPVCLLCVSRGTTQASALKVETIKMPDAVSALSDDAFGKLDWFNRQRPPPSRLFPSEGYPSSGIFARGLHASFARADHIALRMQRLLLTANRALYSLAVVAVAMSAGEVIFLSGHSNIAWVEFATLAVILLALLAARRGRFVERWLSLRYLAERIRSLAFLTPVLGSLGPPIRYIGELDAPLQNPMEEWIRRALDELVLRNPPPTDPNDDLPELKNRLLQEWIYPQLRYQQSPRQKQSRKLKRVQSLERNHVI